MEIIQAATRLALLASATSLLASAVHGETLAEAIAFAYQSNPALQAQRAQLRATDETYVQARSGYGPSVQVQVTASYNQDRLRDEIDNGIAIPGSTTRSNLGSASIVVTQPIYTGGRSALEIRSSQERIRAARETLRGTEQSVVFQVIQAYSDVLRDQQTIMIRQRNIDALEAQLKETQARRVDGEVTRTDVAQAQAQLIAEQANMAVSESQLRTSLHAYTTVVGRNPGALADEPALPGVPGDPDQAFALADRASPELAQARFTEEQSKTDVAVARTVDRPTISLRGSYGYSATIDPLNGRNRDRGAAGEAVLTIPIFSAGRTSSEIRQALELNTSDRLGIESTRRSMVENIANAWDQMVTNRANIDRQQAQVEAAALAFKGMRIEYRAGQRSTLDVLIAEETLRDAELAEVSARHDAYLGEALVLRYIGRLDASDIIAGLPQYDPSEHFRKVEHKGEMPWERALHALDVVRLPSARQRSIPAPDAAVAPAVDQHGIREVTGGLVDHVPITPVPGTVSNIETPAMSDGVPKEENPQ